MDLAAVITGCDDVPVYTCPVAAARAPWVHEVFNIHRNQDRHLILQQLLPLHPSAFLLRCLEYVDEEVRTLHEIQRARLNPM